MEKNATTERAQVHAFVDRGVRDQLHAVARANDRSLAAEIRRAIFEHVQRERPVGSEAA
jgi:predicted transcriptional regulator